MCGGAFATPMTAAMAALGGGAAGIEEIQKNGQGKPEDVGNLVVFLAKAGRRVKVRDRPEVIETLRLRFGDLFLYQTEPDG